MYSYSAIVLRLDALAEASVLAAAVGACSSSLDCFEVGYFGTHLDESGQVKITVSSTKLIMGFL